MAVKMLNIITMFDGINSSLNSTVSYMQLLTETQNSVQTSLDTNLRVNKATDDVNAYMTREEFSSKTSEIDSAQESLALGIQLVKSTDSATDSISSYLSSMKSLVESAMDETDSDSRAALAEKFNDIASQVMSIAKEADYGSMNLLYSDEEGAQEDAKISSVGTDYITLPASNFQSDENSLSYTTTINGTEKTISIALSGDDSTNGQVDWSADDYKDQLETVLENIENMDDELDLYNNRLGNAGVSLELRESYNKEVISNYESVSEDLTIADLNEEAASLLAVQTAQELSVKVISAASNISDMRLNMLR